MGTKMCRISARTTLVFDPKVDIPDFFVLFLKKSFSQWGKLAELGPMGPRGPMGPHGAQHSQFSNFWKNFFQKKYPKIQNVDFGVKTKFVRAEILHILVPIPSRGDP